MCSVEERRSMWGETLFSHSDVYRVFVAYVSGSAWPRRAGMGAAVVPLVCALGFRTRTFTACSPPTCLEVRGRAGQGWGLLWCRWCARWGG